MTSAAKKLLTVIEFIEHARYPAIYQSLGYDVTTEWQVRKGRCEVDLQYQMIDKFTNNLNENKRN